MEINLITMVVPCYNEAASISEFFHRAKAVAKSLRTYDFEIIFVNDGSTDNTQEILNKLAAGSEYVKVLHLARNRGHQIALTAGMDYASGDMIVTIDADLQQPPEKVEDMLKKIEDGYDIVHAQRSRRKGDGFFKYATARIFYLLMRFFSGANLIENSGDFRAFTKPVLETVSGFRTPYRFLRGIFANIGFRQCVIPYENDVRFGGETKYSFLKMLNLAVDAVLGFSPTPIRIITWMSLLLWLISFLHVIRSLYLYYVLNITVPGWTSIIVLMFFFTGLILFSLSIVGAYIGRIFQQGHQKPLYWLSDIRNVDLELIKNKAHYSYEIGLSQRIVDSQKKGIEDERYERSTHQ